MEFLKNWILGICGCTVLLSLIDSLIPKTSASQHIRVCGAVILLFTVFAPLKTIHLNDFKIELDQELDQNFDTAIASNREFEISIIEDRLSEYILQKANQLGIECEVSVSVKEDEEGMLFPQKIVIYGSEKMNELESIIEKECGIKPIFDKT